MKNEIKFGLPIIAFIVVRLGIICSLYWITSGQEVASDTRFHKAVMSDPWGILSGLADISIASYPPLQAFFEIPIFNFFSLFSSEFIAFRLSFSFIELASLILIIKIVNKLTIDRHISLLIISLYIVGPHQFLTSSVFVQEEVIAQFFILLAFFFIVVNRKSTGSLVLALGVLAGKIFLIIPLFYLTLFYKRSFRDSFAWLFLIGTYTISIVWAILNEGNIPLMGFTPDATYASSYWVLIVNAFPENLSTHKLISLSLCICGQLLLTIFLWKKSNFSEKNISPSFILGFPIALFFLTFYQHMPEYLLIIWPILLFSVQSIKLNLFSTLVIVAAWIPNIFFGLKNIGIINSSKSPTRNRVLQPLIDWLGIDFSILHIWSIAVYSVLYFIALVFYWMVTRKRLIV